MGLVWSLLCFYLLGVFFGFRIGGLRLFCGFGLALCVFVVVVVICCLFRVRFGWFVLWIVPSRLLVISGWVLLLFVCFGGFWFYTVVLVGLVVLGVLFWLWLFWGLGDFSFALICLFECCIGVWIWCCWFGYLVILMCWYDLVCLRCCKRGFEGLLLDIFLSRMEFLFCVLCVWV